MIIHNVIHRDAGGGGKVWLTMELQLSDSAWLSFSLRPL